MIPYLIPKLRYHRYQNVTNCISVALKAVIVLSVHHHKTLKNPENSLFLGFFAFATNFGMVKRDQSEKLGGS